MKKILIALGLTLVGVFGVKASSRKKTSAGIDTIFFHSPNDFSGVRTCDAFGCGNYGASRGEREHKGLDFITYPGQKIKAPFDCVISRAGYPYSDDLSFRLVEIKGTGKYSRFKAKVMYVKNIVTEGFTVKKGNTICDADDITRRYRNITPHVHFELYENGKIIDPSKFFLS